MPHHQTRQSAGQRSLPGRPKSCHPTPSHKTAEVPGRIAEAIAAFVLMLSGYCILARRCHCIAGELDIAARRRSTLAFVEVNYRHRQTQCYGLAQKQKKRITRAAAPFVSSRHISWSFEWRFDVILLQTYTAAWLKWWLPSENACLMTTDLRWCKALDP